MVPIAVLVALFATSLALAGPTEQAEIALKQREYDKAADLFAQAVKADATNRRAILGLADTCTRAKRKDLYSDALNALTVQEKVNEEDLEIQLAIGRVNVAIARAQSEPQGRKRHYVNAQIALERALEIEPESEAAAHGLARCLYYAGDFPGAIRVVDHYLSRKPGAVSVAYYWKGMALAGSAWDVRQPLGGRELVMDMLRKAAEAFTAATAADASFYEAWLGLGSVSNRAGDFAKASEAYQKAILANPDRAEAALSGVNRVYTASKDYAGYTRLLAALVEQHPKNEHVLLYAALDHRGNRRLDEAEVLLRRLITVTEKLDDGWYYLGTVIQEMGDRSGAIVAYANALNANENFLQASSAYDALLREEHRESSMGSVAGAKKAIDAYRVLFKLAPKEPRSHNSLGLMLRDAWVAHNRHGRDARWDPILRAGGAACEEAVRIFDGRQRFTLALYFSRERLVTDAGSMFQFHPPIKDYKKAEMYYLRALDLSKAGHYDAWANLRRIYVEQERWSDLYSLAKRCADGLVEMVYNHPRERLPSEKEHKIGREEARGVIQSLLDSGKVSDR